MIHTYTLLDQHIVLDVNSGAVHVVDELSKRLLEAVGENGPMTREPAPELISTLGVDPAQVREAWEELYSLQEQGMLYSSDDYLDARRAMPKGAPVKALCLHVSHDCNLRCAYCFASTGDFGTGRRVTMTPETAKRAIDFVVKSSGKRRNIEIDFFGGEPLMALDTVRAAVEYARSLEQEKGKKFRFTITTNGVLLDEENTAWLNETMDNIVLSLDGRREVNDRVRRTVNGKGSFDTVAPKFRRLVQGRDKDYFVRGTFTKYNLDFTEDIKAMADQGFYHLSVEPVSADPSEPFALTEEDLPRIYEEYEKLARQMLEREGEFNFFHFQIDLAQGPCVIKRLRGCGAGFEYVAITPDGDIYPCHQFVGQEEYRLGNLYDGSFDMDLSARFAEMNVYTREGCRDCWAKFYCSGGCSAANVFANGDMKKPARLACELERKRVECAIALKAAKMAKASGGEG